MILSGMLMLSASSPPMRGWLAIDHTRIVEIGEGEPPQKPDISAEHGNFPALISPAFIDAHFHLPQIDSIGYDALELMQWLERVIYPAEEKWDNADFAFTQIKRAYQRLLRAGTFGGAAFLTSHFDGYVHTVRAGHGLPLRIIVGQSLMDRHAPPALLGHTVTRIASSERSRVSTSINPRFAVSCSDDMLAFAAEQSQRAPHALIHTHLAESRPEVELVRKLFPHDPHYTGVYDRHGLLTERTLLAHCLHLTREEWQLIAERKSVVVHCPSANVFLKSGMFDLNAAKEHNIRLALGSDIAAGTEIAMPRVAKAMIDMAKSRAMTGQKAAYIPSPPEAWDLITRGNAEALGWHDAGKLEIGAAADLIVMQPDFTIREGEIDQHLIARLIHTWRDDYITHRIVNGDKH